MRRAQRNHALTRWGILLASAILLCSTVGMPSPACAVTDFATFEFTKVKIKDKDGAFKDQLDLRGSFTLESDGIDPVHEAVVVNIEGVDKSTVFTQYLPPGSFEQTRGGKKSRFEYRGDGPWKIAASFLPHPHCLRLL